jgi:hypothetical protein
MKPKTYGEFIRQSPKKIAKDILDAKRMFSKLTKKDLIHLSALGGLDTKHYLESKEMLSNALITKLLL